ncbi:hypothetical protein KIW84_060227 [Lathyrus oleraceus]|uniref:Uncharacterized protein n=1 Tax=Pisum sativum TaxID=3888 RepID=A0A9D5A4W5_PEA|nr:hypothetical protein KIW84_060227 [Pisum sativum]
MMQPDTMVARAFKAKYFPCSSIFEASLGNNPSYVWRSLWKARKVLILGRRSRIVDVSKIIVMSESWLTSERKGYGIEKELLNEDVSEDGLVWSEEHCGTYSIKIGGSTNRGWCYRDCNGGFIMVGIAWDGDRYSVIEADTLTLEEAMMGAI